MVNVREIRISIFYFVNVAIMILTILFIRRYNLLGFDMSGIGIEGIIIIGIVLFITLAIIPCMIASIHHLVKATRYDKIYHKEKHYAELHYSRNEWTSFIINNFKKNNITEMKSFRKAAVLYSIGMSLAMSLDMLTNSEERKHIVAYMLIIVICFIVCVMTSIVRNIMIMIDHVLFTNGTIILMGGTIIVNGEIFKLDVPLKKELMKKRIKGDNLEIEYAVPARYSGRADNKRCLNVIDIKKLIIPIPVGKYEEVKKYINAPLSIQY